MKKEKHLKKIISICIFIIVVQGVFLFYSFFFQSKESIYFDGINAIMKKQRYQYMMRKEISYLKSYIMLALIVLILELV